MAHATRPIEVTTADGRYIYNGGLAEDDRKLANNGPARTNRKAVRRKHSTFNIVGALFGTAVVCLLYTSNVIAVHQLAKEVNDLTAKYNAVLSANEVLKVEINRKSNLERISALAGSETGLTNPSEPPVWFEVDESHLEDLQELAGDAGK